MSVTVHTVYLCSVTVLQCKWPRALLLFTSTPPSRPNNISGSQMSVRPSVHKKVSSILMKFGVYVEVDV